MDIRNFLQSTSQSPPSGEDEEEQDIDIDVNSNNNNPSSNNSNSVEVSDHESDDVVIDDALSNTVHDSNNKSEVKAPSKAPKTPAKTPAKKEKTKTRKSAKKQLTATEITRLKQKKTAQWTSIKNRAKKKDPTSMEYLKTYDFDSDSGNITCNTCRDGGFTSYLWTGQSCKPCDLLEHKKSAKHQRAIAAIKLRETQSALEKQVQLSSDSNAEPQNYYYLKATFAVIYFIIVYGLSLVLIKPFNMLLNFFQIANSGNSYVARENGYEMVHSIYSEVKKDRKKLISKSKWVFFLFDESTTKVVPTSMVGIGLSFYNVETHWKDCRMIELAPLKDQTATTISNKIVETLNKDWGIPTKKIIGGSADNCSTNMG